MEPFSVACAPAAGLSTPVLPRLATGYAVPRRLEGPMTPAARDLLTVVDETPTEPAPGVPEA